jgi:hypothetical protein
MGFSDQDAQRKDEKLFILILSALKEPNLYRKLQLAYLLTFNIRSEIAEKFEVGKFQSDMKDLLVNEPFVRAINHRQSIIVEDGNIYFGEEHLACPYNYDTELESTILAIELNLTEFLAQVTNELDLPSDIDIGSITGTGEKK